MNTRRFSDRCLAAVLVLVLLFPTLLQARYKPTTGSNACSRDQEIQAGKEAAADANSKLPVLPENDPLTRYVQSIGNRLAQYAPGEKWPYNFHVVNQKEINAFALPGGPIYVNVGTIQAADNEAQLAGVMAHEISHVVQRHATRAATKQMYAQVPLAILGSLLGKGTGAALAQLGIRFGVGSYFLRNSRQAESEADLIGTDIMYDAGYDPHQMAVFFEKLEAQGGANGPQFFSDHPNPGNRSAAVAQEVQTLPPKSNWTKDTPEFDKMHAFATSKKPLTAQEIQQGKGASAGTGSVASQVPVSSGTFRPLDHSAFSIQYPDNWQVYGDANSAVTIAPSGGVSQNAVAYGAMINIFEPEDTSVPLDQSARELVASLRQSNPDLKAIGNPENARVNGVPAKSLELVGTSPVSKNGQAQKERDWLIALRRQDGTLLYVVFISPDRDYGSLRPTFEQMARSLKLK